MLTRKKLGKRITALREQGRMSQDDLASLVGVHPMTVSKWERGAQELRGANLQKVAKALGVTVETLTEPTENVSRETLNGVPLGGLGPTSGWLVDELVQIRQTDMSEPEKTMRIDAVASLVWAEAARRAEEAQLARAQAMQEAQRGAAARARAQIPDLKLEPVQSPKKRR